MIAILIGVIPYCGIVVIPYCGFYLHLSNYYNVEYVFMCLLAIYTSLEKCHLGLLPSF